VKHWRGDGWLKGTCWLRSPNQSSRPPGEAVSLVVLHNISLPPGEFGGPWVEHFFFNRLDAGVHPYFATIAELRVSAHFLVRRAGKVVQFVGCDARAWHAGQSAWQGRGNCNDYSIGIELEGSDEEPFTPAQYATLWRLLDALRERYPIAAIAGHCHVAPERKTDPGPHFAWTAVRRRYPGLDLPAEVSA
jgi:AmpD protein